MVIYCCFHVVFLGSASLVLLHFTFLVYYKFVAYSLKNRLTELDSVSTVNRLMEFPLAPFIAQPGKN